MGAERWRQANGARAVSWYVERHKRVALFSPDSKTNRLAISIYPITDLTHGIEYPPEHKINDKDMLRSALSIL